MISGREGPSVSCRQDYRIGAPAGEVSNVELAAAIQTTSANSNAVAALDTVPSDPPTFAGYEALRAKVNELILALRRQKRIIQ